MKRKVLLLTMLFTLCIPWLTCRIVEFWALRNMKDAARPVRGIGEERMKVIQRDEVYQIPVLINDTETVMMPLEEYLQGVLFGEMPASFHPEALKAQAVVARTYTIKRSTQSPKHPGGAVCTDAACCQAYRSSVDFTGEQIEKIHAAVLETEGQVLTYQNILIDATYFSCSGGRTEAAVAVWGTDVPYLQAVDSPGEGFSDAFLDTVTYTVQEFSELLNADLQGNPNTWFSDITYTDGGGVDEMSVCGTVYTGTQLRSLLRLRSTAFYMTALGDSVTITTRGYGHRVGMSQYGAEAMAQSGSCYEDILLHYYPGTVLENMSV